MWLSLQKLEMTDFMEEDAKFALWTHKLIYDFKSNKGVKGKYRDAVSLYPTVGPYVLRQISSRPSD